MERIGKKLLLSAGIGLGVAVSGVSLYLLFRPEDEEIYSKESDKRKVRQSPQSVVTIRVPQQCVGAVIGRGGEQIKKIQMETKTRIQFDDTNGTIGSNDNGLKDMRVLLIKGLPENTAKAEMAINEIISEQSRVNTKKFNVDTTAIGCIIGRNGDNIRSLCDRSGAKIKVDRNNGKKSNQIMTSIWITGSDEQIAEAVLLIDREIAQNDNFSRNRSQNYRQINRSLDYKLRAIEDESTDNALNFDNYYAKLEPINEHQMIEVFVSAVKTPNEFVIQIAGTGAQQLDHLMEEMTDFYEIEDNRISFKPVSVKVGDIVAIPYQFDEHWYRAKVMAIEETPYSLEESKVSVLYLDYGDEAVIRYDQICDLKDQLLRRLPFQAMEASLSGVAPKSPQTGWSEEAIDAFKELSHMALWKTLYAKVIQSKQINGKKDKYFIELLDKNPNINTETNGENQSETDDWDESPKGQLNIGLELIRKELAVLYVDSNEQNQQKIL